MASKAHSSSRHVSGGNSGRGASFARGLCFALALALLAACANTSRQFRLEEWGEGWQLKTERLDGRMFRASWVAGENRSLKLVNYHEAGAGGFTVINTLYLEVDDAGTVVNGKLKRVAVPGLTRRRYLESSAAWFRVLEGWCRLDEGGQGRLHVRCEGNYEFDGSVRPMTGLEVRRPE